VEGNIARGMMPNIVAKPKKAAAAMVRVEIKGWRLARNMNAPPTTVRASIPPPSAPSTSPIVAAACTRPMLFPARLVRQPWIPPLAA
jgi:hypothetical protein